MKLRFSSLDVAVMSRELNASLTGLRLQNIYDLTTQIHLLKFQKPDRKEQLIIDVGFRCHLTSFLRSPPAAPNGFVSRLRSILSTRRVTKVSQVGTDRVIEFEFSDGLYRLYLEFFAAGNLVVTDKDSKILALFRVVENGPADLQMKIGQIYKLDTFQSEKVLSLHRLKSGLQQQQKPIAEEVKEREEEKEINHTNNLLLRGGAKNKLKKINNNKKQKTRNLLYTIGEIYREYPSILLEHTLNLHKYDTSLSPETVLNSPVLLESLANCLHNLPKIREDLFKSLPAKSIIIAKKSQTPNDHRILYDEYLPFRPNCLPIDLTLLDFDSFNIAVDQFYSSIEGQKLESKLQDRENAAKKKLEETKRQHQERLGSLQTNQLKNINKARAIEANVERVQEAISAINGLVHQGRDWIDIASLVRDEQFRGNQIALLIKLPLKLEENAITLLLNPPAPESDSTRTTTDSSTDSDSEDQNSDSDPESNNPASIPAALSVDIDLTLSPWANACQYYEERKSAVEKEKRTVQVSEKVLRNAEKKIAIDLKKGLQKEKDILRPIRRAYWFEKFYYFVSSDGYLVVAAKDASQADILYQKYFRRGDLFVHADLEGSSVVIIKNFLNCPEAPIPPATLSQAGTLSICSSTAWHSKAVMAPWWVNLDQVTKFSPHGEYLSPGNFHVKTESKNFLPPVQLLVGIGIIFQISEDSKANHTKHLKHIQSNTSATTATTNDQSIEEDNDHNSDNESQEDEEFPDLDPSAAKIDEDSDDEDFPDVIPLSFNYSSDEDDYHDDKRGQLANLQQPSQVKKDDPSSKSRNTTGNPRISAKERRMMKKGQSPIAKHADESSDEEDEYDDNNKNDNQDDNNITNPTNTTKQSQNTPLPRGKRTKQKKAAAKYAHQDEEDRQQALARIGTLAGNSRKEQEDKERRAKKDLEIAARERKTEQHLRQQAAGKLAEQARQAALNKTLPIVTGDSQQHGNKDDDADAAADNDNDNDEAVMNQDILALECLIAKPRPGDTIISAFPVCAPWMALGNYKYKVKVQPGNVKKGKAAREVIAKWHADSKVARNVDTTEQDIERIWPREAELMQGIKDVELIGVMPVKQVKVMMASGGKDGSSKGKGGSSSAKSRGGRGSKKK